MYEYRYTGMSYYFFYVTTLSSSLLVCNIGTVLNQISLKSLSEATV